MNIKKWKGNVKGGFIMGKVIDFKKVKQNKEMVCRQREIETTDTIENKYIRAWKNLSDEEKLMLQEDLEN